MVIEIDVKNKIAQQTNDVVMVCDNKDYTVHFTFDSEWADLSSKTARFNYNGGHTDVVFSGTSCTAPRIVDAFEVEVGVFAGDLHTTTPAKIRALPSVLFGAGSPIAPTADVYAQIMALLAELGVEMGDLEDLDTEDKSSLVAAINELVTDLTAYRTASEQDVIDAGKVSTDAYNPDAKTAVMTQSVGKDSDGKLWTEPSGGGGTGDHSQLTNRDAAEQHPMSAITGLINALNGKQPSGNYALKSELSSAQQRASWSAKYDKPSGGIPKTDLASAVQTSLEKADSALQEHQSLAAYRTASAQDDIDDAIEADIDAIEEKIPSAATAQNQLADKNFVNSSIATNTANYISNNGQPFTSVAQLEAYSGTVTNNDYAFVTGVDESGNTYFDRYKATVSGTTVTWAKEYRLNNSSFTAAQWAAITSGITSGLVALISTALQPSAIADMATQTWVGQQGFLTAHQSLSAYRTSSAQDVIDATKQDIPAQITTGTSITLADNTEYRLTDVTTLTLAYPSGNFECWLRITTASSGTITITLPSSSYIGDEPTFANGETWELSIKDGVVVAQKVMAGA